MKYLLSAALVLVPVFMFVPLAQAAVTCGTGEMVQHNPAVTHYEPPYFSGHFPHIVFHPGHTVIDTPASDTCVPDPGYVPPTPSTPSAPLEEHHNRAGSGLNCSAVGKVFVNEPGFTGCKDAKPAEPEHPACFYLNALATNGANYCSGTSADSNWLSESFKQAVLALYAKLAH